MSREELQQRATYLIKSLSDRMLFLIQKGEINLKEIAKTELDNRIEERR